MSENTNRAQQMHSMVEFCSAVALCAGISGWQLLALFTCAPDEVTSSLTSDLGDC